MRKRTSLAVKSSTNSLKSGSSCMASPIHALTKNLNRRDSLDHRHRLPVRTVAGLVAHGESFNRQDHGTRGALLDIHMRIPPALCHNPSMSLPMGPVSNA